MDHVRDVRVHIVRHVRSHHAFLRLDPLRALRGRRFGLGRRQSRDGDVCLRSAHVRGHSSTHCQANDRRCAPRLCVVSACRARSSGRQPTDRSCGDLAGACLDGPRRECCRSQHRVDPLYRRIKSSLVWSFGKVLQARLCTPNALAARLFLARERNGIMLCRRLRRTSPRWFRFKSANHIPATRHARWAEAPYYVFCINLFGLRCMCDTVRQVLTGYTDTVHESQGASIGCTCTG